jgi:hypothetical protein
MPNARRLIALIIFLTIAGCSTRNPAVAFDPRYDFTGLRTYDWAAKQAETGAELAYDVVDRAVKQAVDEHMARVGYSRTGDNPSFLLNYWVGSEEVVQITDASYYGPGWGAYWAFGWYGPDGVNVSQYEPGSVTIDAVSTEPGVGLIWRGIAAAQVDAQSSPRSIERAIEGTVREILKDFPPEIDE